MDESPDPTKPYRRYLTLRQAATIQAVNETFGSDLMKIHYDYENFGVFVYSENEFEIEDRSDERTDPGDDQRCSEGYDQKLS